MDRRWIEWGDEELAVLKACVDSGMSDQDIFREKKLPGRTVLAIRHARRKSIGMRHKSKAWTKEEDAKLLRLISDGMTISQIATYKKLPGRTYHALRARSLKIRGRRQEPWSAEEDAYMEQFYGKISSDSIVKRLGRTKEAIRTRAKHLNLGRQSQDHLRIPDLALIFGVERGKFEHLLYTGQMDGRKTAFGQGEWLIEPKAVVKFIKKRPLFFDLKKVDQILFFDLILNF